MQYDLSRTTQPPMDVARKVLRGRPLSIGTFVLAIPALGRYSPSAVPAAFGPLDR